MDARPAISEQSGNDFEAIGDHGVLGRVLRRLSPLGLPAKDLFEEYLRHKWRVNHKPRTIESSFTSVMLFLAFFKETGKYDIRDNKLPRRKQRGIKKA